MNTETITRRELLVQGSTVLAGLVSLSSSRLAWAFPSRPGEEIVPFLDQYQPPPEVNALKLEEIDSWITPTEKFFRVLHYEKPHGPVINERDWKLEITGLLERPVDLTLDDLKSRPRQEVVFTLECAGNRAEPLGHGLIGNARWAGTPLAPILQEAGIQDKGTEVVFFGSDVGEEVIQEVKTQQNFARSMPLQDALSPHNLLCYEMNGAPLAAPHGFPLRLIAPGWYGIANIKWLKRIEVRDKRFMGRWMAREYVTLRQEQREGETVWMETSIGRTLLKSVPVKVTRQDGRYRILGAAWGAPVERVEVRIDNGPWLPATIDRSEEAEFAWKFWHLDWEKPAAGDHTIVSRAVDAHGNIQPAMDDPWIAHKHTRWESNGQFTRKIRIA